MSQEGDQKANDYAELAKENEMLKVENQRIKTQLRQAIDIAQRISDKEKAREEAEKENLIHGLIPDSKFTKEELASKSLDDLRLMRTTLDKAIEKTFASVAAEIDASRVPKKPKLTVGEWDPVTKQWKGGV